MSFHAFYSLLMLVFHLMTELGPFFPFMTPLYLYRLRAKDHLYGGANGYIW